MKIISSFVLAFLIAAYTATAATITITKEDVKPGFKKRFHFNMINHKGEKIGVSQFVSIDENMKIETKTNKLSKSFAQSNVKTIQTKDEATIYLNLVDKKGQQLRKSYQVTVSMNARGFPQGHISSASSTDESAKNKKKEQTKDKPTAQENPTAQDAEKKAGTKKNNAEDNSASDASQDTNTNTGTADLDESIVNTSDANQEKQAAENNSENANKDSKDKKNNGITLKSSIKAVSLISALSAVVFLF